MTAEEFLDNNFESEGYTGDVYTDFAYPTRTVVNAMIDFARLKVREALEAAAEKAGVKTIIPIEHGCRMFTDAYEDVDKESILNAYDLNNIV